MEFIEILLFGVSVCTDCFAVALCSSIGLKDKSAHKIFYIALCFAITQTAFMLCGWAFGGALASFIDHVAKWIGLGLLLFVGGQMLVEAIKGQQDEGKNLNGLKNILLGAMATSIDALAIGSSLSLAGQAWLKTAEQAVSVFVCTGLSVAIGIIGGGIIAQTAGRWAEGIGGIVLIIIGLSIVL